MLDRVDAAATSGAARVIASDLDGTLFGPDHRLSERTTEVLRAARRAGWLVVAATGRAPRSAMERVGGRGVVDGLICSNGSIVHDVDTDATVSRFTIDRSHVEALFHALDGAMPELSFCWEMESTYAWDPGFDDIAQEHDDLRSFSSGPRPSSDESITKVMVRHPEYVREQLGDLLLPHLPAPLTIGCSGVDFVEITGVGVDKSRALQYVATRYGFGAEHVIAFGDNHNDVQMLRWAGHAVAVGNAVEAAKRTADEVIGHHGNHAVASYIESLL